MSTGALFLVGTFMLTMLVDLPIVYGMVLAGLAYLFLFVHVLYDSLIPVL